MTVKDNDETTIYRNFYKGSGNEIKNFKLLTVMNTKGNSFSLLMFTLKAAAALTLNRYYRYYCT